MTLTVPIPDFSAVPTELWCGCGTALWYVLAAAFVRLFPAKSDVVWVSGKGDVPSGPMPARDPRSDPKRDAYRWLCSPITLAVGTVGLVLHLVSLRLIPSPWSIHGPWYCD